MSLPCYDSNMSEHNFVDGLSAATDWPAALRGERLRLRLSRTEVARRSGLSASAIKAYESGQRNPSRDALAALIDALGLPAATANQILAGAGYATNWRAVLHKAYGPRDAAWFAAEVERYTWPVFVTNEAGDIIAANAHYREMIGIPRRHKLPDPQRWNFIVMASEAGLADRLENWDEVMKFMIGLAKALPGRLINPERPAPWTASPVQRFLQGDPAYITRMLKLWEPAQPVEHTTRMRCPVVWRHQSGALLRFTMVMHVADVYNVLAWHDLIPQDAATLAHFAR